MIHSRLSPSSAERWINCPGSARTDLPDESNEAADWGTVTHAFAHALLTDTPFVGTVDDEQIGMTEEFIGYIRAIDGEHHYELRLESMLVDEFGGTLDCVIVTPDTLHVVDLKTGRTPVRAAGNEQLLSYLCLARERFGPRAQYVGHIVQPRLGTPQAQHFTPYDLDVHESRVEAAAVSNSLVAGEWCKFCPLALACETRHAYDKLKAAEMFIEEHPGVSWCLEVIAIADVMANRKDFAERRLIELALDGYAIPGKRLARSLGHRKWIDPDAVLEEFGDAITKIELMSPAQAEKVIGKAAVNERVMRPDLGPTLVALNSKLPPYDEVSHTVFND